MKKTISIALASIAWLGLTAVSVFGQDSLDTLLLRAARSGDAITVQELLQKGANVNAAQSNGATPLWLASQNSHIDVVLLLLTAGASLDATVTTEEGDLSPEMVASRFDVATLLWETSLLAHWSHDSEKRMDGLDSTDQAALADLALKIDDPERIDEQGFGAAVISKMTDQELLAKVAIESKNWNVGAAAVAKLTDQSMLEKIVLQCRKLTVREFAICKVANEEFLANLALNDKDLSVRKAAVSRLSDQKLLAKVALARTVLPSHALSNNAVENKEVNAPLVRLIAVAKLRDITTLRQLANIGEHHLGQMARLRIFSIDPSVERRLGPVGITVDLGRLAQDYQGTIPGTHAGSMHGERLTVVITAPKLESPIKKEWETAFPPATNVPISDFNFQPALVNIGGLISKLRAAVDLPRE